jgi:hypothetical protein
MNNMNTRASGLLKKLSGLILVASVALAGCGGGASTTSQTTQVGETPASATTAFFSSSGGSDLDLFRNNLWRNLNSTAGCVNCHVPGGQAQGYPFAANDVNLAYATMTQGDPSTSNRYINRTSPASSGIVTKVIGGPVMHNCWSTRTICESELTAWIAAWVQPTGTSGTGINLVTAAASLPATPGISVSGGKLFPANAADANYGPVHVLLTTYCAGCHVNKERPYFAVANRDASYAEVVSNAKVNLNETDKSRLYVRLNGDRHNCWTDCTANAITMKAAIDGMTASTNPIEAGVFPSQGVTLTDGISLSTGNRIETNAIAIYEFKEGTGTTIHDTSGSAPAADLTLHGTYQWLPNWGIRFLDSTAYAQVENGGDGTNNSSKIWNGIVSANAYSIEAWVVPANITQMDANMVSFSQAADVRNFALTQYKDQYQAYNRSLSPVISTSEATAGKPVLETNVNNKEAKAELQHVVLTYSAATGRRLYVNGRYTKDLDSVPGASLGNWFNSDRNYVLMLGKEGADHPWAGALRKVVIHRAALTEAEIQQNFAAGVGKKFILMFNLGSTPLASAGIPAGSYVQMQVEEYDDYSYLFLKPTFINLASPTAVPSGMVIKGIRIGVNGREVSTGQAFASLDTAIDSSKYVAGSSPDSGQVLSYLGTVIPKENVATDLFFLDFAQIGSQLTGKIYDPKVTLLADTLPLPHVPAPASDIAVHTFDEIDASLSAMTGVSRANSTIAATFVRLKQQLPSSSDITGFVPSHQTGITELAINYCDQLARDTTTLRTNFFGSGVTFGGMNFSTQGSRDALITPLLNRVLNAQSTTGIPASQPDALDMHDQLNTLIVKLYTATPTADAAQRSLYYNCGSGTGNCDGAGTIKMVTATCAAALGNAATLIK